ncbi:hypothetical protein [Psychrobacter sp. 4Bb]|uniref:hypothetical protein n=1 Tax=Psychrobacter sp. 4Bb TaxID=888436 RepID=UPI000C7AC767|nr:hypothetical protein [Psychrobacter sp. 4Bb]PKH82857.1 hypothetical protein CXF60_01630 [Psychrobacter sp. 4Bb]
MNIFDFKEYLSIDEMITYMKLYNLGEVSKKNAITLVKDLVREDKLKLAIWYKGKFIHEITTATQGEIDKIDFETELENGFLNGAYILIDNEHILSLLAKPGAEQANLQITEFPEEKLYFKFTAKEMNDYYNQKSSIMEAGIPYSSFFIDRADYVLEIDDIRIGKDSLNKLIDKPDTQQQLIKKDEKIAELEEQLEKKEAELANQIVNADKELNPKSIRSVTCLLNVLFYKAQLDINAHKGTTNAKIVSLSKDLNAKITEKPVSDWIKRVQQLRIDTQNNNK